MNAANVDVYFSAQSFSDDMVRNKVAIIIDVLRASSTIVTALAHGAKGLIPVKNMGDASQIAAKIGSNRFLLCGERDGVKIEDFDLGNSPNEYTDEVVGNKTVILTTTNGTQAIQQAQLADSIYIAAFLNVGEIVKTLKEKHAKQNIVLVCSGWKGRMAIEDILLAGYIINALHGAEITPDLPDGAKVALSVFNAYKENIEQAIRSSNHAKRLQDLLEQDDIGFCAQIDHLSVLPSLVDGIIIDGKA
jgi:2-phosphosulfolactate phosphatase